MWYNDTRSMEDRLCNFSCNDLYVHNTLDSTHDLLDTGTFPDAWIRNALSRSAVLAPLV